MTQLDKAEKVSAVVLDVYGTIAAITDTRNPFGKLLRFGELQGRAKTPQDRMTLMTQAISLSEAATVLGIALTDRQLEELKADLQAELASIELYPEVLSTIHALQDRGIKVALCSNLAAAYAPPITRLLPMTLDVYTWSFEARSLKPDPAIYDTVCRRLQCLPQQVLMIGDTQKADVDGPRAFGMQAIRIDRRTADDNAEKISSLNGLFKLL